MVVGFLKGYMIFCTLLVLIYVVRHFLFGLNRMFGRQRLYYNDIYTSDMKSITVVIPMHNEEQVLSYVLDSLLECDYDRDLLEIIPTIILLTEQKNYWTNIIRNMNLYARYIEIARIEESR